MAPEVTLAVAAFCYVPPSQVLSRWKKYSYGADIFSFGCIVAFYINRGQHLFNSDTQIQRWVGLEEEEALRPGYSGELTGLVAGALQPGHRKRPSARDIQTLCTKERMRVEYRDSGRDAGGFSALEPSLRSALRSLPPLPPSIFRT
jgi:hypothetical protein